MSIIENLQLIREKGLKPSFGTPDHVVTRADRYVRRVISSFLVTLRVPNTRQG